MFDVSISSQPKYFPGKEKRVAAIVGELRRIYSQNMSIIAARLTRGAIAIQQGQLLTAQKLDARFGCAPWRS